MSDTDGIPVGDLTVGAVADMVQACIAPSLSPYLAFSLGMAVPYATDILKARAKADGAASVVRGTVVAEVARQTTGHVKAALLLGYPYVRFTAIRDFDGHALRRTIGRRDLAVDERSRYAPVEAVLDNGDRIDLTARDIGTYPIANR